ncbi:hypothetical protein BpHYR1_027075 [Brachionus plicatilis]|uniref:Uncharacterized protein n=1 Tax=Brachionus plicatilis TaxID=10195 RepID=A0A3M7QYF9_BRAPC|nr:hypothetical protein BpHYR1_027075 [Brachionus plicatilis]
MHIFLSYQNSRVEGAHKLARSLVANRVQKRLAACSRQIHVALFDHFGPLLVQLNKLAYPLAKLDQFVEQAVRLGAHNQLVRANVADKISNSDLLAQRAHYRLGLVVGLHHSVDNLIELKINLVIFVKKLDYERLRSAQQLDLVVVAGLYSQIELFFFLSGPHFFNVVGQSEPTVESKERELVETGRHLVALHGRLQAGAPTIVNVKNYFALATLGQQSASEHFLSILDQEHLVAIHMLYGHQRNYLFAHFFHPGHRTHLKIWRTFFTLGFYVKENESYSGDLTQFYDNSLYNFAEFHSSNFMVSKPGRIREHFNKITVVILQEDLTKI